MLWISLILALQLLAVLAQRPRPPGPPGTRPPGPPGPQPGKPTALPGSPTKNPGKPTALPGSPSKNPGKPTALPGSPTNNPGKPTATPTGPSQTSVAGVLAAAKTRIEASIRANPQIAATYLRLGFHDCVPNGAAGGCDGCVNLSGNSENNGLQPAIQSLAPIVAALENTSLGVSRADLWAYAALVAVERSQPTVIFTDNFRVGRKNCETVGTCSSTNPVFCASNGPDVATDFPSSDLTTHNLITFMSDHFGYNADQTVAIMGAHSIGRTLPNNSGFQGAWDNTNRVLDNAYYREIVGSPDPFRAPNWIQITLPSNKIQWVRAGPRTGVMLNADIAIVRDLGIENDLDASGRAQCSFLNNPAQRTCPSAETLTKAAVYRNDNAAWLADFKIALKMMLEKGLA